MPDAQHPRRSTRHHLWWARLAQQGVLRDGRELKSARNATTVRWDGQKPMVTDGPFMEAKETIGGYGVIDVSGLDAAIQSRTEEARRTCEHSS